MSPVPIFLSVLHSPTSGATHWEGLRGPRIGVKVSRESGDFDDVEDGRVGRETVVNRGFCPYGVGEGCSGVGTCGWEGTSWFSERLVTDFSQVRGGTCGSVYDRRNVFRSRSEGKGCSCGGVGVVLRPRVGSRDPECLPTSSLVSFLFYLFTCLSGVWWSGRGPSGVHLGTP